jgi:hypothetical protein
MRFIFCLGIWFLSIQLWANTHVAIGPSYTFLWGQYRNHFSDDWGMSLHADTPLPWDKESSWIWAPSLSFQSFTSDDVRQLTHLTWLTWKVGCSYALSSKASWLQSYIGWHPTLTYFGVRQNREQGVVIKDSGLLLGWSHDFHVVMPLYAEWAAVVTTSFLVPEGKIRHGHLTLELGVQFAVQGS